MDEEYTRGVVIPPVITSSRTRTPLQEWDSAGNYQLIDEKSKEQNSARNYQLIDANSDRQDQNARKILF
jgi:hypothetical protein